MTIRIFVGCSANNEDLESMAVLHYTIEKYATQPVEITWMRLSRDPSSPFYSNPATNEGWRTQHWATPFSGFRWAIPSLCGFAGRAIYFDSDFLVRADVAELNNQTIEPERVMVAKGGNRYCCCLWDCDSAEVHLAPAKDGKPHALDLPVLQRNEGAHGQLNQFFGKKYSLIQPFQHGDWNVLDILLPVDLTTPNIKAIHYTQMQHQLHFKYALPRLAQEGIRHWYEGRVMEHPRKDLQKMFDDEYAAALAAGYTLDRYRAEPYGKYRIRGG